MKWGKLNSIQFTVVMGCVNKKLINLEKGI